ncbi:MAG TPA: serine hydrolase domain-containing protein [Candidatus Eisenbacteria bacterium]|nr:serine hydrolase domain-containing protein [Candidatus Eisenbacteria bacterium]
METSARLAEANRFRTHVVCLLALLLACASPVSSQQNSLATEKRAEIEKAVSSFMSANSVPGIGVAVVLEGEPAWSAGFGMSDLEDSAPATSSTLFRLGSISKPITAVAVLQLWERGKLDLDAPVQKYCPAFPQKEWPITTRELLGHLGGIRHYNPDGKGDIPEESARHFASMEESLQIFAADPLVAKPGTKFNYSTYGYTLLGCVLEGATSQKYVDFVRENVFKPARMEHTQADDFFAVIPHRARWYHKDKAGVVRNAGVLDSSYKIPGGGLISSADDMAQFEAAILADKLLKRTTRDLMWTILKPTEGKPSHYALGWFVAEKFGLRTAGHTGGQQGTDTAFLIAPDRRAGVVVLANMDNVNTNLLADEVLKIALDLKDKTP